MSGGDDVYELKSVKLPLIIGVVLKIFAALVESPLGGIIRLNLFDNAGILEQRKRFFGENPTLQPLHAPGVESARIKQIPVEEWPDKPAELGTGFRFSSIHDYADAYEEGKYTPEDIAEKILSAIETSDTMDPPLRAFISVDREDLMQQARASSKRIREGKALSMLDGVPIAIKDEVDMVPYPTTVGTAFLGTAPAEEDSTVAARMRSTGALLLGKANMHEIGIGVTGLNPHHGTTRNPYNNDHYTGGSSSGPGAATAAGFCPLAIGADGGGSIRIPSSFCGLVGLKATFGRVSEFGAVPLSWSTAHIGPMAGSARDAALGYAVLAGPDEKDANTTNQPTPSLRGWDNPNLTGLKIGIYPQWFEHANPEVVSGCKDLIHKFEEMGAERREIVIPDLEAGRVAHAIAIASEMTQALEHEYRQHQKEFGLDVRINLALARQFTARDYIQSQRVRTRLIDNFRSALDVVDVVVTPATGIPAPPIPSNALPDGESDLTALMEIMRFAFPGNLTGLPAISFPAGYTQSGLPIGLQAIGRPWDEVTLLRLANAAEQVVEKRRPQVFYEIL